MVGLSLGMGLGLGAQSRAPAQLLGSNGDPTLLLQAQIVETGESTEEGALVRAVGLPWLELAQHIQRDPEFLAHFAREPRKFEEFIAATYERAGWDEVILTPQRNDGGRDVIAVKRGLGSLRFLEQVKAYSPGHLVTHADVREMLGVLATDLGASKGLITTTSSFQPGVLESPHFKPFLPHRLELKDRDQLVSWLTAIERQAPRP